MAAIAFFSWYYPIATPFPPIPWLSVEGSCFYLYCRSTVRVDICADDGCRRRFGRNRCSAGESVVYAFTHILRVGSLCFNFFVECLCYLVSYLVSSPLHPFYLGSGSSCTASRPSPTL